jgi:hypothetical protein
LNTTQHMPTLTIDLEAITSHLDALAGMNLCPHCDVALTALAGDIAHLLTQINQLYSALLAERLQSANLLAAIRATLHAHADGEPDPLAYLRDEFAGQGWGQ